VSLSAWAGPARAEILDGDRPPEGKIIASFRDASREKLDETLAGVFGREPTANEEGKQH